LQSDSIFKIPIANSRVDVGGPFAKLHLTLTRSTNDEGIASNLNRSSEVCVGCVHKVRRSQVLRDCPRIARALIDVDISVSFVRLCNRQRVSVQTDFSTEFGRPAEGQFSLLVPFT